MVPDPKTGYFADGKRKIHYVIVVKEENLELLNPFIKQLNNKGVDTETVRGTLSEIHLLGCSYINIIWAANDCGDIICSFHQQTIACSRHLCMIYKWRNRMYNVGLEKENKKYANIDILERFHFKRLPKLPIRENRGELTNANCIIILYKILQTTSFGTNKYLYGITKLKENKTIVDSYPLHDGPLRYHFNEYNDEIISTCNDREILYRFWGSFKLIHTEIPLDLIKTYYGYEIAFCFHWLEYCSLMLLPIALLGAVVILINLVSVKFFEINSVEDVCHSHSMYLCPSCILRLFCVYEPLSEYCSLYMWTYVFDNYWTVCFAILISFWATFFLNVWIRRTNELKLRWDIYDADLDTKIRQQYQEKVKRQRLNNVSGKMEPSMSCCEQTLRMTFVSVVCILLLSIDVVMIFSVFYLELVLEMYIYLSPLEFSKSEKKGTVIIAGSALLVLMININSKIIPIIAKWLTSIEMPKTQEDYDKSYMYKRYILSFGNNYTVLFYTAFLKGIFNVKPDISVSVYIQKDTCQPFACVMDLASQVFFIMLFRRLLWNLFRILGTNIKRVCRHICPRRERNIPQYEEEYRLLEAPQDLLSEIYNEMRLYTVDSLIPLNEWAPCYGYRKDHYSTHRGLKYKITTDMQTSKLITDRLWQVIEYGLVTFFGAAFPLAPLFALLDNIIHVRLIARKLITSYRRPIPRIVPGIGPWAGILLGLMYLSTAVNAFVIAFSTQFVPREVFRYNHNFRLKGFINSTLSEFATKDCDTFDNVIKKQDTCFYTGMREPPSSPNKYNLTTEFWANFTWRLVFLVCFEHLILMLNALLSFSIQNIPAIVRDHIAYNRERVKEAQVKLTKEQEKTMYMRFRGRASAV